MIAHQREPAGGKLHPDLVASAGIEPHTHQRLLSCLEGMEGQAGFFDAFSLSLYYKNLVFAAILPQKVGPIAIFRRRAVAAEAFVRL